MLIRCQPFSMGALPLSGLEARLAMLAKRLRADTNQELVRGWAAEHWNADRQHASIRLDFGAAGRPRERGSLCDRGRGQQQITVKHVTVNADQAVVTDQIVSREAKDAALLTSGTEKPMGILEPTRTEAVPVRTK